MQGEIPTVSVIFQRTAILKSCGRILRAPITECISWSWRITAHDEREVLKLLYQSLRALTVKSIPRRLVRCIYEIRLIVANGEFPGLPQGNFSETALYAVEFIAGTPVEKLYTFTLKEEVLAELVQIAEKYRRDFLPGEFHTLEILETL